MNDGLATLSFKAGAVKGGMWRDEAVVLTRVAQGEGRRGVGVRERRKIPVRSEASSTSSAVDIVALWML
jgi:hypothetical protein